MVDLPETVTLLECPNGSQVFLVGTAHFSPSSVEDVKKTIQLVCKIIIIIYIDLIHRSFFLFLFVKTKPHSVVLELCRGRKGILEVSEETILEQSKQMDWAVIRNIMKREGTVSGLTQALFIKISAKIMTKLGVAPAGEFRAGFREGMRNRCTVYLGDREIRITFKRALNFLPLWQQFKFMKLLLSSLLFDLDISLEEVERMKNADMLEMFTGNETRHAQRLIAQIDIDRILHAIFFGSFTHICFPVRLEKFTCKLEIGLLYTCLVLNILMSIKKCSIIINFF